MGFASGEAKEQIEFFNRWFHVSMRMEINAYSGVFPRFLVNGIGDSFRSWRGAGEV